MIKIRKKQLTFVMLLAMIMAVLMMQLVRANPITIAIAPKSGPVGTIVTVSGVADTPGGTVNIYFDVNGDGLVQPEEFQTSVTAGADAPYSYAATITVPPSKVGTHVVSVADATAGTSVGDYFAVTQEIAVSPTSGPIGTIVTVTGTGFDKTSAVSLKFDDADVTPSPAPETNEVGSFSASFSVPPSIAGDYIVAAKDSADNTDSTTFTLLGVTIDIEPDSGPVGTIVAASGTYATPDGSIKIWWDDVEVIIVTAGGDGAYSYDLAVPASIVGQHTIKAEDVASTNTASKTFTVEPQIVLSINKGPVGTEVTVTGTGFAANGFVDITYDTILVVDDFGADSAGSFTAIFDVPASVAGDHTVTATDTENETITTSAQFTVIPKITIDLTEGRIGTEVQVTGTGFAGTSSIVLTFNSIDVTPLSHPETNEVGSFTAGFIVPPIKAGAHTLTATDEDDNEATAVFTVWDLTISITPTNGPVETTVTVTGGNATPEGKVTIRWDSVEIGTATAATDGTYSFQFKVPASVKGDHTVAAEDGESTNTAEMIFTVEPQIKLDPEDGAVGNLVTVTGNGFSSLAEVDVFFNTTLVSSNVVTNASGSFSMTFNVPWVSTAGNYAVAATDASGVTDDATFTVLSVMYTRSDEYFQGDYPSFFIQAVDENGKPLEGALVVVSLNDSAGYLQYKGVTFTAWNGTVPYDMQFFNWYMWDSQGALVLSPLHFASDASIGTWNWAATVNGLTVKGSFEVVEPVDLRTLLDKLDQLLKNQTDIANLIVYYGEKLHLDHQDTIALIEKVADKLQLQHEDLAALVERVFNELEIKLDDIKSEIVGIQEKVDGLYLVIGNLELKLDDIQAKLVEIQDSVAIVDTNLGQIEVKLDDIKANLVDVQGNIATIVTDIGTIKTDISNINAKIASIEGRLTTIETDIGTIQVDIADINGELVSIDGRLATIETDIGTIQIDIGNINGKIVAIEGTLATIESDIGTIKTDLSDIQAELVDINGNMATVNTTLGRLETKIDNIGAVSLEEIKGDIATIKSDIGTIQVNVNNINANITSIKGRLVTIETNVGTIQEDISAIQGKIVSIKGETATISTDIGTIKVNLSDIDAEIKVTNDNTAMIQTDIGTIKGRLTSVEGNVATIQTDVGTVKTSADKLEGSTQSIKSDTSLQPATIGLSLIAAIGAIAAAAMVLRKVYMK